MQQILIYADSLSWGIIPDSRKRLAFEQRWPGALEQGLIQSGQDVRIIEDCLNGRRSAWDDPYKPGRNGLQDIAQAMEAHSPLALLIVMLGTNDYQVMHPNNAWLSAQGLKAVVEAARKAPIEPGMPVPPILIVIPPVIHQPLGSIAPKFLGAENKCVGMVEAYTQVAAELGCAVFDSNQVTMSSRVDGIHLDLDQHLQLATALVSVVTEFL